MTQSDASTHRHDHNPFAIAHAINSIRRPTTPRETHATEQEATLLTAQRLHCLYQHLRHCQPMSPAQFHSRLTGDGNLAHYPVLLQAAEPLPKPYQLTRDFQALDSTENAQTATHTIASQLNNFDPPETPLTKEQIKQANASLTRSQRINRYRTQRFKLALGIRPFCKLFPDAHATELFIAAHRWPCGTPICPYCGSQDTYVFPYLPSGDSDDPKFLSDAQTGPSIGWECEECQATFTAVTHTVLEQPRVPPVDWLYLANMMLIDRSGTYELDLARTAGSFHGIAVSQDEAQTMLCAIRQAIPFAKPGVRQTISGLNALQTLIRAPAAPQTR